MKAIGKWSLSSFMKILLDIGCYFTALLLVFSSGFLVLMIFSGLGEGATLEIPVFVEMDTRTYNIASPSLGIDSGEIEIRDVQAYLRFPTRRGLFVYVTLSMIIVALALILLVLTQLRHVFRAFSRGQPFFPENAKRIRRIGFAVILGELARVGVTYLAGHQMVTFFTADGIRFVDQLDISVMALIHGVIIIIIAEVFRMGSRLAEEQSLTI